MRNLVLTTLFLSLMCTPTLSKDWQAVLDKLNKAPQTPQVRKQKAVVCNNIAVAAQRKKDWNKAEAWMKKAMAWDRQGGYEKPLASIYLSQAFDSYKKRSNREFTGYMHRHAKLLAERAASFDRTLADAYVLISDIERVNQKLPAARRALEKARRINPKLRGLSARLAQIKRESKIEGGFSKSTNSFFDVRYQSTIDDKTAAGLRLAMTTARSTVAQDYHFRPKHKIIVLVYSSDAFSKLRIGPHWAGGLYDGKIRLPLDGKKNLKFAVATLFHEYTHAVIHDLGRGNCPRWLNEGLAEIQGYKIQSEPQTVLKIAAQHEVLLSLRQLDAALTSNDTRLVLLGYQQSYSTASFLAEKFGYRQIKRLLEALGRDEPFEIALRRSCGVSSRQLETKWRAWLPSQLASSNQNSDE